LYIFVRHRNFHYLLEKLFTANIHRLRNPYLKDLIAGDDVSSRYEYSFTYMERRTDCLCAIRLAYGNVCQGIGMLVI